MDAGSGYSSYLWQDNSTGSTLQANNYGFFWISVTDENGCIATDSVFVTFQTSTNGILASDGQVRIFPNPAKETLHVALELNVEQHVILEMYSITNAIVFREDIKQAQITEAHINVQDIVPGTYFLRITVDDEPHNFLVIVE